MAPARVKHQPRKRFGQHFLADHGVIDDIVAAIDPRPGDALVEIGPGLGALTLPLLERCQRLTVVELDRDLAARLRRNTALEVIEADVLGVDFRRWRASAAGSCASSATCPTTSRRRSCSICCPRRPACRTSTSCCRRKSSQRMAAAPGNKDYGRLTVMLQWRYHIEALFDVSPQAFEPPPRVVSAIVRLLPWPTPAALDAQLLEELVQVAFSQRRKLLRHTLGRWLEGRGFCGAFDVQRRAEEVPVAEYVALTQAVGSA